jgi:hypothetical protein
MSIRSTLLTLRPAIPSIQYDQQMSEVEAFQNNTLRPILKFQNELLMQLYTQYIQKHKAIFFQLTISKREEFIRESFQKDISLKNICLGMIIGHFTKEEYTLYLLHEKEFKKRTNDMLIQRIQDQVGQFE